ncbi:putative autophagy-related protein 9A-like [Apostichopus japonicus]|uniref:Autophagy-related protein 9 n=1 Tax=Stichopus japonicus TaxID=307972 RepID=A0A2G8KPR6_STIJA|nr:putative autophagy-related protein 9A-like [Apostichopus japonicus]
MSRLETEYQRLETQEDDNVDEHDVMLHVPDSGRDNQALPFSYLNNTFRLSNCSKLTMANMYTVGEMYRFGEQNTNMYTVEEICRFGEQNTNMYTVGEMCRFGEQNTNMYTAGEMCSFGEQNNNMYTAGEMCRLNHGYLCMMLSQILELVQFLFICLFSLFLLRCVDYATLFDHEKKISIPDVIKECSTERPPVLITCLLVAGIFWLHRLTRVLYNAYQFWEIRAFYLSALKVSSSELANLTWHDVLKRVQQVQKEQRMCIHKADLTELDIYHRILRFKNYTIAMVNKSLLPLKHNLPFLGELLSRTILWVGLANLLLAPFISLWQILYSFFSYAELIKREPSALGARKWSLYARLYLRHFNELDHEFQARLNRGYKPASKYLNSFSSNIVTIFAQNVTFFAGSVLAVLIILTVIDEDVLTVEHVLTTMTLLGVAVTVCRTLIPDENLIWCPEVLLTSILAQIHYIPDSWKRQAHTYKVRSEFSQLFQYKIMHVIEELLSPIVTPFILIFQLRPRALDIVDFYRNFTVEVIGVGDVCSFAQMDVRNHGNPKWLTGPRTQANQYRQAEDGKTELSLMHFKMTNPHWQPPEESKQFIGALKEKAQQEVQLTNRVDAENIALVTSLQSLSSLDEGGLNSILGNLAIQQTLQQQQQQPSEERSPDSPLGAATAPSYLPLQGAMTSPVKAPEQKKMKGSISNTEGPFQGEGSGLLSSIHTTSPVMTSPSNPLESIQLGALAPDSALLTGGTPRDFNTADMNFSALYMHRLHDNRVTLPESEHEDQGDMPSGSWSTLPQHPLPVVQEQSSLMDTTQSV